jgi:hypothetical protein
VAAPAVVQPALFALREDHRPAGERAAAERYREPSLFTVLQRSHCPLIGEHLAARATKFGGKN